MENFKGKFWMRSLLLLFILLFLDIRKPLGYGLYVEFLFLGIIFVSLNENIFLVFILSIFFGYLKDTFISSFPVLSIIEFPLLCLFIHYLRSYFLFTPKTAPTLIIQSIIVIMVITIHIIFNSIWARLLLPLFTLHFFIQSFLLYFFLTFLLPKWAGIQSEKSTK